MKFKPRPSDTVTARLAEKIRGNITISDRGCWEWQGSRSPKGYGSVWCSASKTNYLTHRAMVWASGRETPDLMEVDHLCRNHSCCNPEHLEVVTKKENAARGLNGINRIMEARAITHCLRGHELNEENTYVCKRGRRTCQECARMRKRRTRRNGANY